MESLCWPLDCSNSPSFNSSNFFGLNPVRRVEDQVHNKRKKMQIPTNFREEQAASYMGPNSTGLGKCGEKKTQNWHGILFYH